MTHTDALDKRAVERPTCAVFCVMRSSWKSIALPFLASASASLATCRSTCLFSAVVSLIYTTAAASTTAPGSERHTRGMASIMA